MVQPVQAMKSVYTASRGQAAALVARGSHPQQRHWSAVLLVIHCGCVAAKTVVVYSHYIQCTVKNETDVIRTGTVRTDGQTE